MSSLRPESHVAQQIRRDKLRIQNSCSYSQEFPNNNLEQQLSSSHNLDLLQVRNVRNANMLDGEPSIYSSSEVPNFQSALLNTLSGPRNTLEYHHQEQLGAAAEPSRLMMNQYGNSELRNLGNWRIGNIGSNQGCDWVVNYASSSMENTESNNPSTAILASQINNVSYQQHYMKPSSYNEQVTDVQSSLNREIQKQLGGMHHNHSPSSSASPLYHNSLQDIVKSASISAQGSEHMASLMQQTGHGIWVGDATELDLHPSYVNQSNHIHHGSGNPWMNRTVVDNAVRCSNPLGFMEKKVGEHPQSLSLSLSSNAQSKTEEGSASDDLHSGCGVSNKDPQYMKCVKSFMKPQDTTMVSPSSTSYKNVGPLGPFTGYATILKSSRFLKSAQLLLDEFCCLSSPKSTSDVSERVSGGEASASTSADAVTVIEAEAVAAATKGGSNSGSSSSMFYSSNENNAIWGTGSGSCVSPRPDYKQKKASLLFMQEEVTKRYKQYHQQMQMVVSSFESVAGLSSSTPYISLALKSVSRHFRCLKNCISDQLKLISEALGEDFSIPSTSTCSNVDPNMGRLRCIGQSIQKNKPSGRGSTGLVEPPQHAWRAQRGLPERAVAILKAWLFEHFLHPYPTDTDKHMLASQTGLSRNQVSNWFINARVRVWKPMVEEIHMLETKGTTSVNQNTTENEGTCGTQDGSSSSTSQHPPRMDKPLNKFGMMHSIPENQSHQYMEMDSSSVACNNAAELWSQEKRSKLECQQQMNTGIDDGSFMGFVPYRRSSSSGGLEVGGLGSVSLTLGLRHGVEGVKKQQQQLQEEQLRHHFGGHMIHDFVG